METFRTVAFWPQSKCSSAKSNPLMTYEMRSEGLRWPHSSLGDHVELVRQYRLAQMVPVYDVEVQFHLLFLEVQRDLQLLY
jgi:hypothetical protein